MAAYKDLVGQKITKVTSNPGEPKTGQMWYNSTSGKLRGLGILEAWASTGPLIEARSSGAGFGVSTAAVYAGGQTSPGPGATTTFEYNGSGWSSGGALNTGRYELGGITAGTETAGLCFGGNTAPGWNGTAATEEYNGTAWTNSNNMATTVSFMGGSGIQTAAFSGGGRTPSNTNNSQEYDGTNWSNGNNINTTRQALVGLGTQTAGMVAGGESPSGGTNSAETYDGTNFTAAPNMGTARYRLSGSGSDSTACLVFGGRFNPPAADKAQTESFDGTSWTETADLATARQQLSGNRGTSSSAIAAGGLPPPASQTTDTEEFTKSTNAITAAAWASSGTYPINAGDITGAGTQTAAICQNGRQYPGPNGTINNTNTYDGSSWTAAPTTGTSKWNRASAKNGSQTAALAVGGTGPGGAPALTSNSEEYNGSSWSEGPNYPQVAQFFDQATGTQTAALATSGYGGPPGSAYLVTTCTYDGTNWTALASPSDLGDGGFAGTMTGIQTAAIIFNATGRSTAVESWNGSTWSEQASMLTPRTAAGSAGTSTDALVYGGEGPTSVSEGWNGTSFSTRPSLANSVYGLASCGTSSAALATAGFGPTSTATEEFTGETSAANITDFTTS